MTIQPKIFKQVRKALGLTQQELADALGLSRVTVNKMENGQLRRGIPDEIAQQLLLLRTRLLSLRKRQDVKDAPIVGPNIQTTHFDNHLWDNEEDES